MKLVLNLATRSYPNRRALSLAALLSLAVLIVALLSNLIGWVKEDNHYRRLSGRLAVLEQSLEQQQSEPATIYTPAALEAQRTRISLANRLLEEDAFRWTALLDRFEAVLPAGIRLRTISPSFKDGRVSIAGWAEDLAVLRTMLDRLLASDHFSAVRLGRQSLVGDATTDAHVQFSLSLIWKEQAAL